MNIFWFRRDLRLEDNAGLYHALKSGEKVQCIFIFDNVILNQLEDKDDARVEFIFDQTQRLKSELQNLGSDLWIYYSTPSEVLTSISNDHTIKAVYTNHDYEPYAKKRDLEIFELLDKKSIAFYTYKDQVIFEKDEILKDDGKPYTIFTPYKNKWYKKLTEYYLKSYPTEKYFQHLNSLQNHLKNISLAELGFEHNAI